MSMVSVQVLRDAKRLGAATSDSLSPTEWDLALSVLGTLYGYYDDLATYTAFANGRIERLREALRLAIADKPGWRNEARAALAQENNDE